jgi:quaternary ammonium compound-resistance protein SugE
MAWLFIFIAGLLEIAWAIGLKYSDGFTKPLATVLTIILMILSFVVLAQGIRTIPVGTGYAVWTGIGAAGTAILGVILFNEPLTAARVGCLAMVIAGIVGLKLVSPQ